MANINSLKDFRISTGLSPSEFAIKVKEEKGNYSKRENGNNGIGVITPKFIKKIKKAFPQTDEKIFARLFELSQNPTIVQSQIQQKPISDDEIREQLKTVKTNISILEKLLADRLAE